MRHTARRSNNNRGSGNNNRNAKRPNKMKVFESNGPDVKIRGTAYQVTEKYEALAKDAETSGNFVLAENYRQHAEHYYRIINSFAEEMNALPQQGREDDSNDAETDFMPAVVSPARDAVADNAVLEPA